MRIAIPLLLALASSAWADPTLQVGGTCPGTVHLRITDLSPHASVALVTSDRLGAGAVPGGPCAGTPLGLGGSPRLAARIDDANGLLERFPTLAGAACSGFLQVVDLQTCEVSDVRPLQPPVPEVPLVCGRTGDLLEHVDDLTGFGFTSVPDTERIVVTPSHVHIGLTAREIVTFTHTLEPTGRRAPTLLAGNESYVYDPIRDEIHGFQMASPTTDILRYGATPAALQAGPSPIGHNTAAGLVDDQGHLHLPDRDSTDVYVFDRNLDEIDVWTTDLVSRDLDLGPEGLAYHLDDRGMVAVHDLTLPGRPRVATWSAGGLDAGLAIDGRGVVYVHERNRDVLGLFATDGTPLGSIPLRWGDDPGALVHNPYRDEILVGYQQRPHAFFERRCPYVP